MQDDLQEKYDKAVNDLMKAEKRLSNYIYVCEEIVSSRENGTISMQMEDEQGLSSEGQGIRDYLEMYIDKMSIDEMITAWHTVEMLKQQKLISWNIYLDCGIALLHRVVRNTDNRRADWKDELDKLLRNRERHQNHREAPGLDTRFYGEMNINMESAIDYMRWLREAAERNNVSLFYMAALNEQEYFRHEPQIFEFAYDTNSDVDIDVD